ncbi:MAG: class I SAM-dependent methyltransferase, partial [Planctomycetota bacterium]
LYGVEVRIATFAEVNAKGAYDGIWANFSLLHAPRAELPGHLSRLHRASRPGGPFHIGMKTGTGEKRDRLGRFYAFYGVQELTDLLEEAGFTVTHAEEGEGPGLAGDVEPWVILAAHA